MKIAWFPTVLTLIVAAVLSWLAYDIAHDADSNLDVCVAVGTGISVLLTLGGSLCCKLGNARVGINLKVWSGLMFIALLVSNFCFAGFGVKMPWYAVVTICFLVLHVGVAWSILKVKNV